MLFRQLRAQLEDQPGGMLTLLLLAIALLAAAVALFGPTPLKLALAGWLIAP